MGKKWILKRRARPTVKQTQAKTKPTLTQITIPTDPLKKKQRNPKIKYKYKLPDSKGW